MKIFVDYLVYRGSHTIFCFNGDTCVGFPLSDTKSKKKYTHKKSISLQKLNFGSYSTIFGFYAPKSFPAWLESYAA